MKLAVSLNLRAYLKYSASSADVTCVCVCVCERERERERARENGSASPEVLGFICRRHVIQLHNCKEHMHTERPCNPMYVCMYTYIYIYIILIART